MRRQPATRTPLLERLGPDRMPVTSGAATDDACRVRVTDAHGHPLRGIRVRFRIVSGPASFVGVRGRTTAIATDRYGRCGPTIRFRTTGTAVIVAWLNDHQVQVFQPYTEGTTHHLFVTAPPCIDAADGRITVSVSAVDHKGDPVRRAPLALSAVLGQRVLSGRLRRAGLVQTGALSTRIAGAWTIVVADDQTGARATAVVQVRPGAPFRLRILGDPDPRLAPPYNESLLRVTVVDKYGNGLDPGSIRCAIGKKAVPAHALVGEEARFRLDATGFKILPVTLSAAGTTLRLRRELLCAAAWLGDPGLVIAGSQHRTPVFLTPWAGTSARTAHVRVSYDPKQAMFQRFTPDAEAGVVAEVEHTRGRIEIAVTTTRPITHRRTPEGIPIGYVTWQCLGAGSNCVSVTAAMSPQTPPWEKCTSQKENLRKTVCLNFIYCEDDPRLRTFGTQQTRIRQRLERIYNDSSTIKTCCPFLDFQIHMTGMSTMDWLLKVLGRAWIANANGSGSLASSDEMIYLGRVFMQADGTNRGTTEGVRGDCVNFYLVDIPDGVNGRTNLGPTERVPGSSSAGQAGFGVIDPDRRFEDTVAHELGHALGMGDDPPTGLRRDRDELMNGDAGVRTGTRIKRLEDCRAIWQHVDAY